jgi:hypothetical protein
MVNTQPAAGPQARVRPLFLFSLPRTGSTLVQRILGTSPQIATASEPWILLPLLSMLHEWLPGGGPRDALVSRAVADFATELPGGSAELREELQAAALRLYARAARPGAKYYLDKTPMYHLVVQDILDLFPDGKFIFLWRNPLAVVASMVELFDQGRWRVHSHTGALFGGLARLVRAYEGVADRAHAVRYEDLATGDEETWRAVFAYLEVPFEAEALTRFPDVRLRGQMGDIGGRYEGLSTEPLAKWRQTLRNPVRRAWCRSYLHWIGPDRLATMGYDLDLLLGELAEVEGWSGTSRDLATMGRSVARDIVRARIPLANRTPSGWRHLLGGDHPA